MGASKDFDIDKLKERFNTLCIQWIGIVLNVKYVDRIHSNDVRLKVLNP